MEWVLAYLVIQIGLFLGTKNSIYVTIFTNFTLGIGFLSNLSYITAIRENKIWDSIEDVVLALMGVRRFISRARSLKRSLQALESQNFRALLIIIIGSISQILLQIL